MVSPWGYKRLEKGSVKFPVAEEGATQVAIAAADLGLLLSGIDLASVKRQKRFRSAERTSEKSAAS